MGAVWLAPLTSLSDRRRRPRCLDAHYCCSAAVSGGARIVWPEPLSLTHFLIVQLGIVAQRDEGGISVPHPVSVWRQEVPDEEVVSLRGRREMFLLADLDPCPECVARHLSRCRADAARVRPPRRPCCRPGGRGAPPRSPPAASTPRPAQAPHRDRVGGHAGSPSPPRSARRSSAVESSPAESGRTPGCRSRTRSAQPRTPISPAGSDDRTCTRTAAAPVSSVSPHRWRRHWPGTRVGAVGGAPAHRSEVPSRSPPRSPDPGPSTTRPAGSSGCRMGIGCQ